MVALNQTELKTRALDARFFFTTLLAVCVVILGSALLSQFVGGLFPCELCLLQRIPYDIVIPISAIGAVIAWRRGHGAPTPLLIAMAAVCALALAAGAAVAGFHVGVEQGWWQGTESCTGGDVGQDLDALRAAILEAPAVRCDEVAFELFGVSMAGWNFLASVGMVGVMTWVVVTWLRPRAA